MEPTTMLLIAVAVAAVAFMYVRISKSTMALRLNESGAFSTGYAVVTGIIALLTIAVGVIIWGLVSDTAENIDMDYTVITD